MIERIASPKRTREIINQYGFTFHKKFGQNFLIDSHVLDKIVRASDINDQDIVVEIGPGIGSLTQILAEHAKEVIAIEIDKKLIPILEDTLSPYDNIRIINEDVLKVDLLAVLKEHGANKVKVVANLPYYITTPIIMGLFEKNIPIDSITVMVQKEVADRMKAEPSTKDYGALSLAVQYYSEPYIAAFVPPNCFIPRPNVGSAVIRLKKKANPSVSVKDESLLFSIIRAAFNQRRKTLVNSLVNYQGLEISKEKIIDTLDMLDLDPRVRGEALALEQFVAIANELAS